MERHKIALVFFSGTGVTKTYIEVLNQELYQMGCTTEIIDITTIDSRQNSLPSDKFIDYIFGFPVFADFAPTVVNDFLSSLDGNDQRCAMFFTYGGRTTGYAHFHTKMLLEKVGFTVLFSGEFLGRHSFNQGGWRLLPDRPNEDDFVVVKAYAKLAYTRFQQENPPVFRLQKPFGYTHAAMDIARKEKRTSRGLTQPVRTTKNCQMCRACETECPTGAFDADSGLSDINKCIECMHCVYCCPDQVIHCDPQLETFFPEFLDHFQLTEEMSNAKKSKIITDFLDAAC